MKKWTRPKIKTLIPNFEDSWAEVELYRWQHNELPTNENSKPLDISKALEIMGNNMIGNGDSQQIPSPFNVGAVLLYLAKFNKN